jgi:hypothetical protein
MAHNICGHRPLVAAMHLGHVSLRVVTVHERRSTPLARGSIPFSVGSALNFEVFFTKLKRVN